LSLSILRSTACIRERCNNVLAAVEAGQSAHFSVDPARLEAAAGQVAQVTRTRYPTGAIPYHSRWRHFEAGGVDRGAELSALLAGRSAAEAARARIDLAVTSVLLDAGAGADWSYDEAESGRRFTRSEGLGVASLRAFMRGAFSSKADDPLRVDAAALQQLDVLALAAVFQAGDRNPLVGLEGRAQLMRRLGAALAADPVRFGAEGRPGALFDRLAAHGRVTAEAILRELLDGLSGIWLTGRRFDGQPLGDAWRHPAAGGSGATAGWVPLHKLSQWLAYSLLEPFEWAGVKVSGLDGLTALPEYRNGGLLLDCGVIRPRDPALFARVLTPADEPVIEWRALTVALIDRLAPRVRARLGADEAALPLARVLEGGTWAAGRQLAQQLRGGLPPLRIDSDGTVF
jgi:hypothetical protein